MSNWIHIENELPEYAEPVLIKANSVTQNITWELDEESNIWFSPFNFDSELRIEINKVQGWQYLPN